MNIEEFNALIADDANRVAVNTVLKAAGYETPDGIKGLLAKRDELLGLNIGLKEDLATTKKTFDGIDPAEYKALKSSGKVSTTEIETQYQGLSSKFDDLVKSNELTKSALHNVLKESALKTALVLNKFSKNSPMLTKALLPDTRIDEERLSKMQNPTVEQAMTMVSIPDEYGVSVPIDEYLKSYAGSDVGKYYLDVPKNSSANTERLNGDGGGKKIIPRAQYDQMSQVERNKLFDDGGDVEKG